MVVSHSIRETLLLMPGLSQVPVVDAEGTPSRGGAHRYCSNNKTCWSNSPRYPVRYKKEGFIVNGVPLSEQPLKERGNPLSEAL